MFQKKYNVFDEWGNKIGVFVPSGDGTNFLVYLIFIIILWTIGFLIFLLFKGAIALLQGRVLEGLSYLIIPVGIIIFILLSTQISAAKEKANDRAHQETQTVIDNEKNQILSNPNLAFELKRIGNVSQSTVGCGNELQEDISSWYEYQFTNTSKYTYLNFHEDDFKDLGFSLNSLCYVQNCYSVSVSPLDPGESISFYCSLKARASSDDPFQSVKPCFKVGIYPFTPLTEICDQIQSNTAIEAPVEYVQEQSQPVQVNPPIDSTPNEPILLSPLDGTTFYQSNEINLSWQPGVNASEYIVQIGGPPGADGVFSAWQPYTSINFKAIIGGDLSGWTYSWTVKARNSSGVESDWSAWRSFTVEAEPKPVAHSRPARISDEVLTVFVRKTPGFVNKDNTSDVVVSITNGELVEILRGPEFVDGLQWWYVTWNGYEGWIAEKTRSGLLILLFNP